MSPAITHARKVIGEVLSDLTHSTSPILWKSHVAGLKTTLAEYMLDEDAHEAFHKYLEDNYLQDSSV